MVWKGFPTFQAHLKNEQSYWPIIAKPLILKADPTARAAGCIATALLGVATFSPRVEGRTLLHFQQRVNGVVSTEV